MMMRFFFHLLALVALLIAPLAVPTAAMAAQPSAGECTELAIDVAGHDMPAGDHGQGQACCIAVPPAIDPPQAALNSVLSIQHLAFVAMIEPFRLGAGPKAEDPPPRTA